MTPKLAPLGPFRLQPILLPKVWGGRRLAALNKDLPPNTNIGESWELADLSATSASGAGGGAQRSNIASGPLAGRTLRQAIELHHSDIFADAAPTPHGDFPLLVKFLDAAEHLSVQVHPSIDYCKRHPDAHLKTECWYIIDALPGSRIFKGVKPGVSRADFELALRAPNTQGSGVVDLLDSVPAVPGDCHLLPSGTVHALGAGVLVAEVQTPSDTTFRVYDWAREYNRAGRELHADAALECISFEPARDATRRPDHAQAARLVSTGFFDVDEFILQPQQTLAIAGPAAPRRPRVLIAIRGSVRIHDGATDDPLGSRFQPLDLKPGDTALIPAAVAHSARVTATDHAPDGALCLRAEIR